MVMLVLVVIINQQFKFVGQSETVEMGFKNVGFRVFFYKKN